MYVCMCHCACKAHTIIEGKIEVMMSNGVDMLAGASRVQVQRRHYRTISNDNYSIRRLLSLMFIVDCSHIFQ